MFLHLPFHLFLTARCLIPQLEVLFLPHILCIWTGLFDGREFHGVNILTKHGWIQELISFFRLIFSVSQAPWFWNLRECWAQYPLQVKKEKPFTPYPDSDNFVRLLCRCIFTFWLLLVFNSQVMERAHYCYYMLELGFYLSLLLRISVDVRRKVKISIFLLWHNISLVIDTPHSVIFEKDMF